MLEHLFSPFTIRGKVIKNRIVVPAMVTNYCTSEGKATDRFIAYHEAKAKGGFGLIITEDYAIDPLGRGFQHVAGLWNDDQIESHSELPKRVHKYGATILAQIYHAGRQTESEAIKGEPVSSSPIPSPFGTEVPKELTTEQVKEMVSKYGDTALRAKKCGFDGVEIHGGHGYLITQFLSPFSNKRVDEYGGSFLNRARFALEIIRDIRTKCGEDFIVGMRISADEMVEGGLTIEDNKALVPYFEEAGVDLINVSVGNYLSIDLNVAPSYVSHGWFADMAKEIKEICNIPVIAVSRINNPILANSIIKSGKADFTAMGRASLADQDMPNKAKEGKFEEIRRCIGCNHGCLGSLFKDQDVKCVLNPTLGNELSSEIEPAKVVKKVAVIGAGPAGLEAAMSAKKAGHYVTVYEKDSHAGGQFYLAAIPPCKGEITDFIVWQTNQCKKLNIPIKYNTEATVELMKKEKVDAIILATGAAPFKPPIKGIENNNVVLANDVLAGKVFPGANCVVIGGGQVGAETANYLGQQLRNITVLEMGDKIAPEEAIGPRWQLLKGLENRKVSLCTSVKVTEITENSVKAEGKTQMEFPADTVVIATGSRPVNALKDKFSNAGFEVKVIGDANKVGLVMDATTEGFNVGRAI
ncbi:FAD-dependent oxidoreductase [Clostridium sp. SHJSY1]|uniref:oxidoreductase n=1 Tax=Clostridium sp. SHJSY1 TaxID=2942483 RepID=UPI002876EAB2|nr:FAD-dependent oxidoreductase [Clostridium sp. SHJSY1]MDS0524281.1 FAD-dependent oxidoreductase [Clostridium sp. SHJSY1]